MTTSDITELRLLNQLIETAGQKTPLDVVRHMGALQAQDYNGALWALGLRTGLTEKEIISTVESQKIIRTWPQRGTLHFVSAEDAKWLVGLSAERLLRGAVTRRQRLGLDDKTLNLSRKTLSEALSGKLLTRPQIMEVLETAGISTKGGRGYHILWYLSQTGVTFIGPMRAKQQTIGLLDDLTPNPKTISRQAGIAELAKRYFISHGPATIQDFMWWTGLTAADAKAGLEANKQLLNSVKVDGKEYWLAKKLPSGDASGRAFLLPGFDEYMLGYKDRSAMLQVDHADKIVPGSNGMFLPTVIIRGQVVGTWKRTIKKDHVQLDLAPFKKLTAADIKLLQQPAESYGRFLGLPAYIGKAS